MSIWRSRPVPENSIEPPMFLRLTPNRSPASSTTYVMPASRAMPLDDVSSIERPRPFSVAPAAMRSVN